MLAMIHYFRQGTYWELVAKSLVLLSITLCDGNGVVVVLMVKTIIRHVPDPSKATTSVQKALELGFDTGPNLDPRTVAGIRHGDVVDVQILHNIGLTLVLAEGADTDAMGAITDEVLDQDICTVGLERNTVCNMLVPGRDDGQ